MSLSPSARWALERSAQRSCSLWGEQLQEPIWCCISLRRTGDFRLAWCFDRSSFLSRLFCLAIVFSDTLKRSAKQIKDNVTIPSFFHVSDNKTCPFSYRMCIAMWLIGRKIFSVWTPFFSSLPAFFPFLLSLFLFFKHCPFQNKGRFSTVPVPQWTSGVTSLWQLLPRAGMQSSCNCAMPYCWCMSIRTYELRKICSVHSVKWCIQLNLLEFMIFSQG